MSASPTRNGFALVAVLWLLLAAGAASLSLQAGARTHRLGVINASARAETRWAAREGLAVTLDAIERSALRTAEWEALGLGKDRVLTLTSRPDVRVTIRVGDARARLNLNRASPAELDALLGGMTGGRSMTSQGLRDRILDWRDADHVVRPGGAERDDYARLGWPARIGNGPFEAVSDIEAIAGITPEMVEALSRYVTVVGDGRINVNTADPLVLATLPGIDRTAAARLAARRVGNPYSSVFQIIQALPREAAQRLESRVSELESRIAFSMRSVELEVIAAKEGSGVTTRIEATVLLEGQSAWRVASLRES